MTDSLVHLLNYRKMYETERTIIVAFSRIEMLNPEYGSWFHDPDVTRFNSHGLFPYTKKQREEFLRIAEEGSESSIVFAVYAKCEIDGMNSAKYIGNISLQRINYINRSAEVAWVIGDKSFWGKGYGTEVGSVLLHHGFEKLNLHRIWTGTSAKNIPMQKVIAKLGMNQEGTLINGMFVNGEYHNIYIYAIFDHDYREIHGN